MNRRIVTFAASLALAATLGACSGAANVAVTNPLPAIQGYIASLKATGSATTAVETTKAAPQVQQTAPDLTPYRCEYDETLKVWIVYYYSPSQKKSYRCKPNPDKTVTVVEVTDVNLVYTEGDTLETAKVTVDAATAAQTAANQAASTASPAPAASATPAPAGGTTTTNVTNTNVVINNITLISAGELRKKHKRVSDNPAYVVVTNNQPIYIDASTGNTITATDGSAVTVGSGTAVGGTVTTTPAPTATATPAPAASPTAAPTTSPAPTTSTSPAM